MFDFLIPRSNLGSNMAPILEGVGGRSNSHQNAKNKRNMIEIEDFAENLTIGNAAH